MDKEETSIHWHGIILPNFQDGVPYLTTPPIKPKTTFTYRFPLKHSGTYWYHSHTGLQEQIGVYGGIVVHPKKQTIEYDKEIVLVLSDWTDENPSDVLKTLKRGSEWYSIKKKTVQSLNKVIKKKALGTQLKMWKRRMPGMDISDVYYDRFLINGKESQTYTDFNEGEKVRIRVMNAASSTYFWLSFGGENPMMISSDGVDVQPFHTNKVLQGVAETYDFIVSIPKDKAIELKAFAQDGSGFVSAVFGKGTLLTAPEIPKPDLIEQMKMMSKMHSMKGEHDNKMKMMGKMHPIEEGKMKMDKPNKEKMPHHHNGMHKMGMTADKKFSYDQLKALEKTSFPKDLPVKKIELNLTGNMWRYIWSINGKTLSEVDKIKIKRGEVVRVTLNNKTMMHHPMHLHGHFFRVLNKNKEYSPLKHTVDVPPMASITIEFYADKTNDWFFHCHVLYHVDSGMARVFSYGDPRNPKMEKYPLNQLLNMDKHWFKWGQVGLMSNRADLNLTASNTRNQILFDGTFGWVNNQYQENKNFEFDVSYERFLGDYFRLYGGLNAENETENDLRDVDYSARAGIRYLLPYFINFDISLDSKLRPQLDLEYEVLLFPRLALEAKWEWQLDFGAVEELPTDKNWKQEHETNIGLEYILSKNASIIVSYSNKYGYGGGLRVRF